MNQYIILGIALNAWLGLMILMAINLNRLRRIGLL